MPIVKIKPYRLTKPSRKALIRYLRGQQSIATTANDMQISRQRVYTMSTAILRHAVAQGEVDIDALLKDQ